MRFCDKLPKLRKDNNLSQEGLADRMGVSRQAVSKWESGSSYPDMDKMIQLCGILNCTLEDLLDDGVIGNSTKNKNGINGYFQDFLKFITRIYNMFCSMTFKQKIKCLLEMAFIIFILYALLGLLFAIFDSILFQLILNIPSVGEFFYSVITSIAMIILIIIGVIIFVHLFKVRYLDYYVTVEDVSVLEKTIEAPIDNPKREKLMEKSREKIIIRDPKHSSFSFLNLLLKIIVFFLKILAIFISIFVIISFVFLVISLFVTICHFSYGTLFIWISIAILGMVLINYDILEIIYKFVISRKQAIKRIFIVFILGLVLIGAGTGLSIVKFMSFEKVDFYNSVDYITDYEEIDIDNISMLNFYLDSNSVKYIIDDSSDSVKLEIRHLKEVNYNLDNTNNYYSFDYSIDFNDAYKIILNDLKEEKYRDYSSSDFIMVTVVLPEDSYSKLDSNYKNYFTE